MASTGQLWWVTPLQCVAMLGAAANFGGSALQSPLIFPMLQHPRVPAVHSGSMTAFLLQESEKFFPPLNALCTASNLAVVVTAYLHRNDAVANLAAGGLSVWQEKLRWGGAALACCLLTTVYALGIMVPMNKRMTEMARILESDAGKKEAGGELRRLQIRWQKLNYGRAMLMIGSAVTAMMGVLAGK